MVIEFDYTDKEILEAMIQLRRSLFEKPYDQFQFGNAIFNQFIKGFTLCDDGFHAASLILFRTDLVTDHKPIIFFGFFDAIDFESGAQLMEAVQRYCKINHPGSLLIGPVNSSTWGTYRMAVNHFDSLFPGDVAGKPHYPEILEKRGFKVHCSYSSNLQTLLRPVYPNELNGFRIVYLSKEDIIGRMQEIYDLSMDAFRLSPLFQPIGFDEFKAKYSSDLVKLDAGLMPFAMDEKDALAAYLLAYPSFSPETLTVKTLARKSGRQYAGLGKLLANEIVSKALKSGYNRMIHAFMNQSNVSNVLSKNISGQAFKCYHVYSYEL